MADAVIYARYSSHNQREASIDDQVRVCTEAAERAGDRIVAVYADRARSGRDATKRAEFLRMIDDAKTADWKRVYLYKTDRFARNRYDAAIYRAELKKRGVSIVAVMEPMGDGPEGILMETLMEGLAEYYSANLAQNVRRGLEGNALQCKHNGCKLYGYTLGDDGHYHVNEEEAPLVRKVFGIFADGGDSGTAARALAGLRTPSGAKWDRKRILSMVRNEKYAGTYVFKDHRVPGGMEAIVSPEIWERANSRRGPGHARTEDYPLTGKLFDSEGRPFVGHSGYGKNRRLYRYYAVRETGESHRKEDVESAVYEGLGTFLSGAPGLIDELAEAVVRAQGEADSADAAEMEAIRTRLRGIERESANVVESIAKLGYRPEFAEKLDALDAERDSLKADLADLERSAPRLTADSVRALIELIIDAEAPMEVVSAFVERIVIDGDAMEITFRIAGEYAGEDAGRMSVRTVRDWLGCRHRGRTLHVLAGAGSFSISFRWR